MKDFKFFQKLTIYAIDIRIVPFLKLKQQHERIKTIFSAVLNERKGQERMNFTRH